MSIIRLAGCVIFNNENKILLIHRNKNGKEQWETPGGKVEPGEPDETAAIRELKEELGTNVTITGKIGEGNFNEGENQFHYVWFKAALNGSTIHLEPGFIEYNYFSPANLKQTTLPLSAGTKKLLELFF